MKTWIILAAIFLISEISFSQNFQTPFERSNYSKLTSFDEMNSFLYEICKISKHIKKEYIGVTDEGRRIPVLQISSTQFDKDRNKLKVLIFAQQHGDEPSGKEGLLMLVRDLALGKQDQLLKNIDLLIVPQMNPDGAEKNRRRNSLKIDLNRDHLILTAPETQGLHKLFHKYLPEVALDVHEYSPYGKDWKDFGYIKNFDEQFGCNTNLNVDENIRKFSKQTFLPYIKKHLNENGFSFNEYIVGSIGKNDLIRHSTVDIDDGRQGFGIYNTFSFILEGKNGKDSIDNIKKRSTGQYCAITGFLKFVNENKKNIEKLVKKGRSKLNNPNSNDSVVIRMDHFKSGNPLKIPLLSLSTGKDSIVTIPDYHPVVKPIFTIKKPSGYLVPKNDTIIVNFLKKHNIHYESKLPDIKNTAEKYLIETIDSISLEDTPKLNPQMRILQESRKDFAIEYYFVPVSQLASNLIILAFEPASMLGLVHYDLYKYLMKKHEIFPILRVL